MDIVGIGEFKILQLCRNGV